MKIKKFKRIVCMFLLVVMVFSMMFGMVAQADSPVHSPIQVQPAFGASIFNLGDAIKDVLQEVFAFFSGEPYRRVAHVLFQDTNMATYIQPDNPHEDNPVQKWFDIFTIAGLMFIPLIAIKVALMLIGTFVNPGKRSELKDFIKNAMLYLIIIVCAKEAILWLVELNDALVALFYKAANSTIHPYKVLGITGGIGGLIFGILVQMAAWVLSIYIWLVMFLRKIIIMFAYMLIPVAAIMLFSKKFGSIFKTLYEEVLSAIFQQAIYAGTFIILHDALVTIAKKAFGEATDNPDTAYGFFLRWFAQGETLGPLGWVVLMALLIFVARKLTSLLSMQGQYAPDAGNVMKGTISGMSKSAEGFRSFAQAFPGNKGIREKMARFAKGSPTLQRAQQAASDFSKSKPAQFAKGTGKFAGTGAMVGAAAGLGVSGISPFSQTMNSISDAKTKAAEGWKSFKPQADPSKMKKPDDDDDENELPDKVSIDKESAKNFGYIDENGNLNPSKAKETVELGPNGTARMKRKNEKGKDLKDDNGNQVYDYFKKDEISGVYNKIEDSEAKAKGLPEAENWKEYGGSKNHFEPDLQKGEYRVKCKDFRQKVIEHYTKKQADRTVIGDGGEIEEILGSQQALLDYEQNTENGKTYAIIDGEVAHFMGCDLSSGHSKLIKTVSLNEDQKNKLKEQLGVSDDTPQICALNVDQDGVECIGGFEDCNEYDVDTFTNAITTATTKQINKQIRLITNRCNNIRSEEQQIRNNVEVYKDVLQQINEQNNEQGNASVDSIINQLESSKADFEQQLNQYSNQESNEAKKIKAYIESYENALKQIKEQSTGQDDKDVNNVINELEESKSNYEQQLQQKAEEREDVEKYAKRLQELAQPDVTKMLENRYNNLFNTPDIAESSQQKDTSREKSESMLELANKYNELVEAFNKIGQEEKETDTEKIHELLKQIEEVKEKYNNLKEDKKEDDSKDEK